MASFLLGAIIGFLIAVLALYWQQIMFLKNNAGTISDVGNIYSGFSGLFQKL